MTVFRRPPECPTSMLCLALAVLHLTAGCGGQTVSAPPAKPAAEVASQGANRSATKISPPSEAGDHTNGSPGAQLDKTVNDSQPAPPKPRSLADLLAQDDGADPFETSAPEDQATGPPQIDGERAAASGVRKLTGKHITLYTDLPPDPAVDELPQVFDLAVPQWCDYFQVDYATLSDWRMNGYLMNDEQRFRRGGLLPEDMPQFMHGIQRGHELWLREQPSDYYRRHLLLHEGTHGFMHLHLGGGGPPWYSEAMAELLGTHRWQDGQLTLRYFPQDKSETLMWGRIKIIQDEFQASRGKWLREIMHYERGAHLKKAPYGWCWAAAAFLDNHPRYQERFRQLHRGLRRSDDDFNDAFEQAIGDEWPLADREWVLFVINIEYGYDIARETIEDAPMVRPVPAGGDLAIVSVDRGWQSSGYRLEAGVTYSLTASGRYQIAAAPKTWWCEPGGVTIRFHRGMPLGVALGAVVDDDVSAGRITPLASPMVIGLGRSFTPERSGVLYLRANDSPAELADNTGEFTVRIAPK